LMIKAVTNKAAASVSGLNMFPILVLDMVRRGIKESQLRFS